MGRRHGLESDQPGFQLFLPKPQFLCLLNGDNDSACHTELWGWNEMTYEMLNTKTAVNSKEPIILPLKLWILGTMKFSWFTNTFLFPFSFQNWACSTWESGLCKVKNLQGRENFQTDEQLVKFLVVFFPNFLVICIIYGLFDHLAWPGALQLRISLILFSRSHIDILGKSSLFTNKSSQWNQIDCLLII